MAPAREGRNQAAAKPTSPRLPCGERGEVGWQPVLARKWIPYRGIRSEWPGRALPRIDRAEYGVQSTFRVPAPGGVAPLRPCDRARTLLPGNLPSRCAPCGLASLGDHAGVTAPGCSPSRPTVRLAPLGAGCTPRGAVFRVVWLTLDVHVRAARARGFAPARAVRAACPGSCGPRRHGGGVETCAFTRAEPRGSIALVDLLPPFSD